MAPHTDKVSLQEWFATPLGAYVLAREQAWIDRVVPNLFGYHAVQVGLPGIDLLRESRIVNRVCVDPAAGASVRAAWHELPFDAQSVDLCVLPHTLEFCGDPQEMPHAILREVDRIMRPEGRILIIGFNPWSLFGLKRLSAAREVPWSGDFVSLVRMKDWLQLLGFETAGGAMQCFIPPCRTEAWQRRWGFMETMGERWWSVGGAVYLIDAIKRVQGMRLIAPAWSDQRVRERKLASVAKRNSTHARAAMRTPLRVIK
ncbi:MAG: methyltransferase domain-containing protein [Betaproteobacteria bacterium]|nr:methyltransferase domain-containing protein [Betaproteobacteria bacterium]